MTSMTLERKNSFSNNNSYKKISAGRYRLKTEAELEIEMYRDKGTGTDKYFQKVK